MSMAEAFAFFSRKTPHIVVATDSAGIITQANTMFAGKKKSGPSTLAGKSVAVLVGQQERAKLEKLLKKTAASGKPAEASLKLSALTGRSSFARIEAQPFRDGKKGKGHLLFIHDPRPVTRDGKTAQIKKFLDTFFCAAICLDHSGRILFRNAACRRMIGEERESFFEFFPDAERKKQQRRFRQLLRSDKQAEFIHALPGKRNSKPRTIRWRRLNSPDQQHVLLCGVDITGEINYEAAFRKNEQRLREAQKIARIGSWEWTIPTGELYWSDEIFRIFGRDKRIKVSYAAFLNTIHPDDRPYVELKVQRALDHEEKYDLVHRIVLPDGRQKFVREIGEAIFRKKKMPVRMVGTVQDVTEQVLLEKKYRDAHLMLENSVNAIVHADTSGNIIYANPASARLWGYNSVTEMLDYAPSLTDFWHEDTAQHTEEIMEQLLTHGYYVSREKLTAVKKDKTVFHPTVNAAVTRSDNGEATGLIGFFTDATEKVLAEERLRHYDDRLRFILSNIDEIIYSIIIPTDNPLDWSVTFVSDAFQKMTGVSSSELRARWRELIHSDDLEKIGEACVQMITKKSATTLSYRVLDVQQKNYRWFEDRIAPVLDANGTLIGIHGSARDISERIRYEEELVERKQLYKSLFENALVGIFRTDVVTQRAVEVNDTCYQLFGYESREAFFEKFIAAEHYADSQQRDENFRHLMENGEITKSVVRFRKANGGNFWGQFSVKLIPGTSVLEGVVVDISDQIGYEEKLKASLEEKDLLLKEVHHRVKNNLQVISGLLQMQIDKYDHPDIRRPLTENLERIRSIAIAHERLYRDGNFASVHLNEYLHELSWSAKNLDPQKEITFVFTGEKILLDIARAIPLGMIFNELVANSLKHGFRDKNKGSISVDLSRQEGEIRLRVEEDGAGFRGNEGESTDTLGWKLITALVRQIRGKVHLYSDPGYGMVVTIVIPVNA